MQYLSMLFTFFPFHPPPLFFCIFFSTFVFCVIFLLKLPFFNQSVTYLDKDLRKFLFYVILFSSKPDAYRRDAPHRWNSCRNCPQWMFFLSSADLITAFSSSSWNKLVFISVISLIWDCFFRSFL